MENGSGKLCRENQNAFYNQVFFPENRAVCDIMWKNPLKPGRPDRTIWRTLIASWIIKATNIHSKYVTLTAFQLQQCLHERSSMLHYTYIVSLVNYN